MSNARPDRLISARRKRLPPYANEIPAFVQNVYISAGPDAWPRAQRWARAKKPGLVAPPDTDPKDLHWPVDDLTIALIATDMDEDALVRLIVELQRSGAACIVVLHGEKNATRMEIIRAG
jgi:hypothetical protein